MLWNMVPRNNNIKGTSIMYPVVNIIRMDFLLVLWNFKISREIICKKGLGIRIEALVCIIVMRNNSDIVKIDAYNSLENSWHSLLIWYMPKFLNRRVEMKRLLMQIRSITLAFQLLGYQNNIKWGNGLENQLVRIIKHPTRCLDINVHS